MKRHLFKMAALSLVLVSVLGFAACGNADGTTDIMDYVTVDFSGDDGEGTAYVNIDYNGLETDMVGGTKKLEAMNSVDDLSALSKYINTVASMSFNIDNSKELSNGDVVTVTVTYDTDAAAEAGVTFSDETSRTFTVKGLE